jgi:ribosomal protein S18 acetylase RimI-like enzyme
MESMRSLMTEPEVAPLTVDRLRQGETRAAATLLARSFLGEPLFGYIFEGVSPDAAVRAMESWFSGWIRTFARDGEIHTARRDNELVGVAIRLRPDCYPLTGLRKVGFNLRLIKSVLRMGLTTKRAFSLPTAAGTIGAREPDVPFWNLAWIGVDPEQQRTGIGSALADEAIRVVDAQPAMAWLVTFGAHTRAIYEQRGFVVEDEIRPIPDGPIGWTMRRESTMKSERSKRG